MNQFDKQYIDLCRRILETGEKITNYSKADQRDEKSSSAIPHHIAQGEHGSSTIRLPHQIFQFDLEKEFPILTSKKVSFKTAILENFRDSLDLSAGIKRRPLVERSRGQNLG